MLGPTNSKCARHGPNMPDLGCMPHLMHKAMGAISQTCKLKMVSRMARRNTGCLTLVQRWARNMMPNSAAPASCQPRRLIWQLKNNKLSSKPPKSEFGDHHQERHSKTLRCKWKTSYTVIQSFVSRMIVNWTPKRFGCNNDQLGQWLAAVEVVMFTSLACKIAPPLGISSPC